MAGFHPLDLAVVAGYFVLVMYLARRAAKGAQDYEGFFLAGRKLGRAYQFFLNFGNSTDANTALSVASLVYRQGVSGAWLGFQLVFLNPYFWFMNMWFRRARLVTMADLFEDRLGSRLLASFYALFHGIAATFVVIGFGNLVTYKISAALIVKPDTTWTPGERAAVEGYRELQRLETGAKAASLTAAEHAKLSALRERDARGELTSYVSALKPLPFHIAYTLVIGLYVVLGGMTAAAMNEVLQCILTVAFSVILIPLGLRAIGGWEQLGERVPAAMFELLSVDTGAQRVTGPVLFAVFLVAIVQINGIIENMALGGSARNEFAARFGAVSGTYAKRVMTIMWAFCGLIALAMYAGPTALSDPDAAWGMMSRDLLGPGLLGLMLVGLLANNMDTIAVQTLSISALFVRNVYRPLRPNLGDRGSVTAGRWAIVVVLLVGLMAALSMDNVFTTLQLVQTVSVPFGAAVLLMFFWRRLTVAAIWIALIASIALNILGPHVLAQMPALRTHATLVTRAADASGRAHPVFFESVIRTQPNDALSPLAGRGRLHLELVALRFIGVPVERFSASGRFAARFMFDAIFPFILLIACSFFTRPPERARVDQFFGRMKTPVGATPELDEAALEATRRAPDRFNHLKLFPTSSWEMTKWDRVDAIGFIACCAVSGAIIALFWGLLRLAERGAG
jgi:solute:Na+ symporter, SSS family